MKKRGEHHIIYIGIAARSASGNEGFDFLIQHGISCNEKKEAPTSSSAYLNLLAPTSSSKRTTVH